MSVRNLAHLFQPRSVAVIGASEWPQNLGIAASDDRQSTNSALDLQPPTAPSTRNPSIAPGRSP